MKTRVRNTEIIAIISLLSSCGDYDHKTKNEVILRCIARLLALLETDGYEDDEPEKESIPF